MSSERPEQISEPEAKRDNAGENDKHSDNGASHATTVVVHGEAVPDQDTSGARENGNAGDQRRPDDASRKEAIVLVRGETVRDQDSKSASKDSQSKDSQSKDSAPKESQSKEASAKDNKDNKDKEKAPRKKVAEAKVQMQSRLPALDDDRDVGVQKEQVVTRDGKADLSFTGTLLASAAPPSAPKGQWEEYRIYETNAGKHVFSKVSRSVFAEEPDTHEAEVFDPSPSSMPSQLLRSARDLARSRPLTWKDAAVAFFGYDELAKTLYRKLSGEFEEHIS
jgi:hypothetical protein